MTYLFIYTGTKGRGATGDHRSLEPVAATQDDGHHAQERQGR